MKKARPLIDVKELELPETHFVRDIDDRVFKSIVIHSIEEIDGVEIYQAGRFLEHLLSDGIKGVSVTQDTKTKSVGIRVEVTIRYGESIPEKSEEIQSKVAKELAEMTGLHVSGVHVLFRGVYSQEVEA